MARVSDETRAVVSAPPGTADAASLSRLAGRHSTAELLGQFVLSRSLDSIPEGWPTRTRRTWALGAHATLPVRTMRASDGVDVGWLLGFPVDARGYRVEADVTLPIPSTAAAAEFETFLYGHGGRYIAVWLAPHHERVYLDAGGTLSAVYSPAHAVVAATPALVPYTFGCADDTDLLRVTGMPSSKAVLAFGMTSRVGVERLLPNHYLDLLEWKARRHWPHQPLDDGADPAEAAEVVARVLERQIGAVTRDAPAYMSLTAGFDSRTMLACAREHLGRIRFITLALPDAMGRLDVDVARRIARRHGLAHDVLPNLEPDSAELDAWLWRTGLCVSEPRGWRAVRTYGQLDPSRPEIVGTAGEVARAVYWRDCGGGRRDLTADVVVESLMLPKTPGILERARAWMNGVPATRPMHLIDAIYIEQRLGCWAGVFAYGDAAQVHCRIKPFVHRDAFTAMLRLPDAYKLAGRFPREVIASRWPELARIPFNRRAGARHYADRLRRRAHLVRRALARRLPGASPRA